MELKNTVPKAVQEGFDLINSFYGFTRGEVDDKYLMKDSFRQDVYRLIILQMHMAIESVLKDLIVKALPKRRAHTIKQNKEYVGKLRTWETINMASRLGIINKDAKDKLLVLNNLRNECAHNWLLGSYTMKKNKELKRHRRKYSAEFNGKSLLRPSVIINEFVPVYSEMYLDFLGVSWGIRSMGKYVYRQGSRGKSLSP